MCVICVTVSLQCCGLRSPSLPISWISPNLGGIEHCQDGHTQEEVVFYTVIILIIVLLLNYNNS